MTTWEVLIVDNHPISRAGLKLVLEDAPDFVIVGEAYSGQHAVRLCDQLQPHVILMDINMPNGNGIEATTTIHRQFPQIIIIGVSAFCYEEMHQEIFRAGAVGYISKDTEFDIILERIRALVLGKTQPILLPRVRFSLTLNEQRVLMLLSENMDRQQIADQLGISLNTVKMHLRNLYQKLGVSSASDAVKTAFQERLIS